jgi:hypothetical protein
VLELGGGRHKWELAGEKKFHEPLDFKTCPLVSFLTDTNLTTRRVTRRRDIQGDTAESHDPTNTVSRHGHGRKGDGPLRPRDLRTLELAEQHECLVANGIGGFASGTISVMHFEREALRHYRPAWLPLSNDGASTVSKRQAESQNNSTSHF